MIMRLRLTLAGSLIGGLMIWACGGEETAGPAGQQQPSAPTVASVVITPDAATLVSLGETVQLTASAQDANGNAISGKTFTWTTSDAGVATVDASTGLVTAVDNGEVVITATTEGQSGSAMITVASGSFQATVSGDLALSLSGSAVFGVQTQQGQQAFAIGFIKGDPGSNDSDIIVISRDNTAIPGPGTYTIVSGSCTTCTENDFASGFLHQVTSLDFGIYFSESGSLTLSSVSSELLEGFFSFTATAFLTGGSVTAENLTIEGTFIAVPGDIPSIS